MLENQGFLQIEPGAGFDFRINRCRLSPDAAYQLHFYLCLKTHYLQPLLTHREKQLLVRNSIDDVCKREQYHLLEADITQDHLHDFVIDRIGLLPDHMHLIFEGLPYISVEEYVLALMENTRYWMTKHYSGVLKQTQAWNLWQPSFYAGTVGEYSTA